MDNLRKTTVYHPHSRLEAHWFSAFVFVAVETFGRRALVWQLVRRELFAEFRASFIGPLWIALAPLAAALSWIFLNRTRLLNPGDTGVAYPAFILVGTTLWSVFVGVFNGCSAALIASWHMIQFVRFPHEVLFVVQAVVRYVNLCISLVCAIIILAFFQVPFSAGVLVVPLMVLPLIAYGVALGMAVSVVTVVSYDFRRMAGWALGLVLYVTPVVYASGAVTHPFAKKIIEFNPLAYQISAVRDMVLFGSMDNPAGYWYSSLGAVIALLIAWRLFFVSEDRVMERIV